MTNYAGWRRFLTCATIDVLLLIAAGSAMAAPEAAAPGSPGQGLPALLLLGFGLCGVTLRWRTRD